MTDLFALARACGAHVGHSTIGGDPKNRRVHYSFDPDQLAAFAARTAPQPAAAAAPARTDGWQLGPTEPTDAELLEVRDSLLPSQGESFDTLAFARAVIALSRQPAIALLREVYEKMRPQVNGMEESCWTIGMHTQVSQELHDQIRDLIAEDAHNAIATPAAALEQAPDAAEPVAWMRDAGEDSISTMSFCCTDRVKKIWLKANPRQVERYTIPLYAAPQAPAQALTNEEIAVIESDYGSSQNSMSEAGLMRAVERAVWAKNGIAPSAQGEKQ